MTEVVPGALDLGHRRHGLGVNDGERWLAVLHDVAELASAEQRVGENGNGAELDPGQKRDVRLAAVRAADQERRGTLDAERAQATRTSGDDVRQLREGDSAAPIAERNIRGALHHSPVHDIGHDVEAGWRRAIPGRYLPGMAHVSGAGAARIRASVARVRRASFRP